MTCRARRLAARRATTVCALVTVPLLLPLLPLPVVRSPATAAGPVTAARQVEQAMPRQVPRRTLPAAPHKARRVAGDDLPFRVLVGSVTPSALPQRPEQRLVVTGRVTNTTDDAWGDLRVYLVSSAEPLRSPAELAAAVASEPGATVGERIVEEGLYDEVGDLAAGRSAAYRLSVPRSALPVSAAGVYWLAVHVLGTAPDGARDAVADGRARTLVPLMPADGPSAAVALTVPFRAPTGRLPDGRLLDASAWERTLRPAGRLGRLLGLAGVPWALRTTWVVDPAVLDAVRSVAAGDPPLDLGPTTAAADPASPDATPEPSPGSGEESPGDGGTDGGTDGGGEEPAEPTAAMQQARSWLDRFTRALPRHALATLPYGDVDVAAALRTGQDRMLAGAVQRSADAAERLDTRATPVVAPPSGRLPSEALTFLPPGARIVLGQGALEGVRDSRVDLRTGATVAVTGADLATGGPSPPPRTTALAMRQRILAEAAVHALGSRADRPLVLTLPPQWDPGPRWRRARFWRGMAALPWLTSTTLPAVLATRAEAEPVAPSSAVYPAAEQGRELPVQNFDAVRAMIRAGDTLAGLLTLNDQVDEQVERHALLGTSVWMRRTPLRARMRAVAGARDVRGLMAEVGVRTQSFVTMSSDTGSFQVTLINGLDQMVTAGVRTAVADQRLTVEAPPPVRVPPGERRTIRVEARATDIGVHRVAVVPVNADGMPTGPRTTFDVRSSNVGLIIWVIMGAGAVVLLAAVAVRIGRRVRRRRATPGPLLDRDPVGHR